MDVRHGSSALFVCVEQRGAYYLTMPITIEREKFCYAGEWADAYGVTPVTVQTWCKEFVDFPCYKIGEEGNNRGLWIIHKKDGKAFMREALPKYRPRKGF